MSTVAVTDAVKKYDAVAALDGVTMTFRDGEFFGLLGPSGSGKTTLLRAIAGFVTLDRGQVLIDGQDVGGVPVHARNIGMVFQNYALFPHMSVAENVAFGLEVRGRPREDVAQSVKEALAMVRLGGLELRKPKQLSGGQQQRVALARALVTRPKVLLLDEPLGALDKHLRQEMQVELRRIQRQVGITTIFVTHDQEEALTLSDRIAIFDSRPHHPGRRADGGLRAAGHQVRRRFPRRSELPARPRDGDRGGWPRAHRARYRRRGVVPAVERAGGADGAAGAAAGEDYARDRRPGRRSTPCAARCWTSCSPATARPIGSRSASR